MQPGHAHTDRNAYNKTGTTEAKIVAVWEQNGGKKNRTGNTPHDEWAGLDGCGKSRP